MVKSEMQLKIKLSRINTSSLRLLSIYGKAVYFMAFCSGDKYLMLHSQIIDNHQIRQNDNFENPLIWNIQNDTAVKNYEGHKDLQMASFEFPNHVYGMYQLYDTSMKEGAGKDDDKIMKG